MKPNDPLTAGTPSEHVTARVPIELLAAINDAAPSGQRGHWMRLAFIAALEAGGVDVTDLRAAEDARR